MGTLDCFSRFFLRFRYPVTLPEDIGTDLGLDISNFVKFEEFIRQLTSPRCCPTRLKRYMPREKAEQAFNGAQRKEQFMRTSLFSYYFSEGWVEFELEFDSDSLLRRIYIHHRTIPQERGIELPLEKPL